MFPFCRTNVPYLSAKSKRYSLFVALILPICRTNPPYLSHHLPKVSLESL